MLVENWRKAISFTLSVLPVLLVSQFGFASKNVTESKAMAEEGTMKIHFVFDDRTVTATLNDSPSARDFVAILPLTLELEDYASTEKIAYLPSKLTK